MTILIRLVIAGYRAILRAYPRDFRDRCRQPMLETFEHLCHERAAHGIAAVVVAGVSEYLDAMRGIAASRRRRVTISVPRLGQEFRHSLRRLAAQPGLVVVTLLTLGFSIAASTAIFSVVDAVLLRPSPFTEAGRLVQLLNYWPERRTIYPGLSREKLRQWRSQRDIFERVEAYRATSVIVTGGPEPEEIAAAHVSPGLLTALGIPPRFGRGFDAADRPPGGYPTVIVSERYWRSRLGHDSWSDGRTLDVNGRTHTIVGVMPSRFNFPTLREQVWLPMDPDARPAPGETVANTLVQLQAGLSIETARERIAPVVARLQAERPLPTGWGIALEPGPLTGPDDRTRRTTLILFGAVVLVLLTACANVANLLLSRAVDRERDFAIQAVLGAGRGRLIRELLLEGLLLGTGAAAIGLAAAWWAVDQLVALAPPQLTFATSTSINVDIRVALFGIALALLVGVLCNVPPALRAVRAHGNRSLSGRSRISVSSPVQRRVRAALVIAEVALAVVLLVGAGLMVRSFARLNAIDLGYDPDNVLAVTVGLDQARYPTEESRSDFLDSVAKDVSTLPGVTGVAIASGVPPSPGSIGLASMQTHAGPCGAEHTAVVANLVSPSYFGLMGIRFVAGRSWNRDDSREAIVVSRSVAARCGGEALIGQSFRLDARAPWLRVVGIAEDVKTRGLTAADGELAIYLPPEIGDNAFSMVAGTLERRASSRRILVRADHPLALADRIKQLVWAHDASQPVLRIALAGDLMAESVQRERFVLTLLSLFSLITLVLAAAGIFGALAYAVARRKAEIGIRLALGASARDVKILVAGHSLRLSATGVVIGLAGALATSRVLAGLLFEVQPRDPFVFLVVPLVVFAAAAIAAWIPTLRALSVDPATALRAE